MNSDRNGRPFVDVPTALLDTRKHIIFWVAISYIATVVLQWTNHFEPIPSLFFHLLLLLHCSLYWHSESFTRRQPWLYLYFQGILIAGCALLMPEGYQPIVLGLIPVLIGQSAVIYPRKLKVVGVAFVFYVLVIFIVLKLGDHSSLIFILALFIMMNAIVIAYISIFQKEVLARLRTESFLNELKQAHWEVERLTLANERQRMARDLHDTLAQGLAGLVMQLDAADAYITKGNMDRAGHIVRQSREGSKKALAEARKAIDNLRLLADPALTFEDAIRQEVERFSSATGIRVELVIDPLPSVSQILFEHAQHMIRESLTNIARHAGASQVRIQIRHIEDRISVEVQDNGNGFDAEQIGRQPGHYGLIGLQERARLLHGKLTIESAREEGTLVKLEAPCRYPISFREDS
ncbi:sensor histidine kinase [Cohnella hashimotonis]|uniref:histidine kinase n=1 Tax=Cohnella hashimotonis TaxID=2826895 RepID=A0ABT6TJT8_9BACL|nr:sensor histidine kinase [Cohnella hashimotonis]